MKVISQIILLSLTLSYVSCYTASDKAEVNKRIQESCGNPNETELMNTIGYNFAVIDSYTTGRAAQLGKDGYPVSEDLLEDNKEFLGGFIVTKTLPALKNATNVTERLKILMPMCGVSVLIKWDEERRANETKNDTNVPQTGVQRLRDYFRCPADKAKLEKENLELRAQLSDVLNKSVEKATAQQLLFYAQFQADLEDFYFRAYTKALNATYKLNGCLQLVRSLKALNADLKKIIPNFTLTA